MVAPTKVIEYIKGLIDACDNFSAHVSAIEGSEDSTIEAEPPLAIIYADLDQNAELDTSKRIIKLLCSIYIVVTSASLETGANSFNQAFEIAVKIYSLIAKNNAPILEDANGSSEQIQIRAQDIPLTILKKSAEASSIQLAFNYHLKGFLV